MRFAAGLAAGTGAPIASPTQAKWARDWPASRQAGSLLESADVIRINWIPRNIIECKLAYTNECQLAAHWPIGRKPRNRERGERLA